MCGRFNVIDDPFVQGLMDELGIPLRIKTRTNIAPGASAQIVFESQQGRILQKPIWSLLIERNPDGHGYRPSPKYSTFNARAGSLETSPLWSERFRTRRAIIPASGFHEWTGEKGHKRCYNIRPEHNAIAFSGLYAHWDFEGEIVTSFTIITLPSHPRFRHIHPKSLPLMLTPDDFDLWLDPTVTQTTHFQNLLTSRIREPLIVEPVWSPATLEPKGPAERMEAD